MEHNKKTYLFLLAAVTAWCLLLLSPLSFVYNFFGHICHQIDSRSLHYCDTKLAVCARCSGIYFGFLFGLILVPLFKKVVVSKLKIGLLLITLPMVVDFSLDFTGIHESNLFTRAITGLIFGISSAIFIYPSFQQAINEIFNQRERKKYYVRKT